MDQMNYVCVCFFLDFSHLVFYEANSLETPVVLWNVYKTT